MKNQAFFSSKDKSKKLKCRLLQFLFGALKVKLLFTVCAIKHFKVCNTQLDHAEHLSLSISTYTTLIIHIL